MYAFLGSTTATSSGPRSDETVPNSTSPDRLPPPRLRQKRSQVARACDWCRVHRIRCDNNHPCLNCYNRGGQCSNDRTGQIRTLPHAFREIERLKQRNEELQKEIEEERCRNRNQVASAPPANAPNSQLPTPPSIPWASSASTIAIPSGPSLDNGGPSMKYWEGIYTSTARSPAKTWYGPSSLLFFISRLNTCLASKLQQHLPDNYMQPNSASRLLDGPTSPSDHETPTGGRDRGPLDDPSKTKEYLSPTQEEYFLDFYWQSFHTSLIVFYEDDFKQHYKSLWAGSRKTRKPSALVDIVLALCMQYGVARARASNNSALRSADIDTDDATLAGRWHFCRCQSLLASESESPTIQTIQCNILAVVWLCIASFQNMADSTLAITIRLAQTLGLHLPPPPDMPQREKELRRWIWWSIYVCESKTSMKLGRLFLIPQVTYAARGLPDDSLEGTAMSGSDFAPLDDNTTWLSFGFHDAKLVFAARNIYTAFYEKYPGLFDNDDKPALATLETHADIFNTHMKALDGWVAEVPTALKIQRQNHGTPLSTDCSSLDIEQFAPPWLQRQRLLLELLYHNLCTNLYRPFIWLKPISLPPPPPSSSSPESLVDSCAHNCAKHAMALTHIMRQVLSTTDLLTGWHESFQWQWNCAITLVGFILEYPQSELTQVARDAINFSIDVFCLFGKSFAVATSAANVVRKLGSMVDHIIATEQAGGAVLQQHINEGHQPLMPHGDESTMAMMPQGEQQVPGIPDFDDETVAAMQEILAGSMDLAFTIDGYHHTNILWPGAGPTE
ncbi:fungal-specific transcription factor domain-containing protein [Hypoxylon trugodes]|uniref:fungal-specific transcription factor domain-containing protein n=1 Tax=Hypoxylon trugodes TaxID=326681 RepID=UPI00219E1CA7|nr:fungal-specific transcription factor domain-containing protein [Hypoxylon trugodes]KAI1393284.1 fungal-specific transcription factor domain-containing protein [Hypoxylon trugodes]